MAGNLFRKFSIVLTSLAAILAIGAQVHAVQLNTGNIAPVAQGHNYNLRRQCRFVASDPQYAFTSFSWISRANNTGSAAGFTITEGTDSVNMRFNMIGHHCTSNFNTGYPQYSETSPGTWLPATLDSEQLKESYIHITNGVKVSGPGAVSGPAVTSGNMENIDWSNTYVNSPDYEDFYYAKESPNGAPEGLPFVIDGLSGLSPGTYDVVVRIETRWVSRFNAATYQCVNGGGPALNSTGAACNTTSNQSTVRITVDPAPSSMTGSISCGSPTANSINVSYDFQDAADTVTIQRRVNPSGSWSTIRSYATTNQSGGFTDTGLSSGTSYRYRLMHGGSFVDNSDCSTSAPPGASCGGGSETFNTTSNVCTEQVSWSASRPGRPGSNTYTDTYRETYGTCQSYDTSGSYSASGGFSGTIGGSSSSGTITFEVRQATGATGEYSVTVDWRSRHTIRERDAAVDDPATPEDESAWSTTHSNYHSCGSTSDSDSNIDLGDCEWAYNLNTADSNGNPNGRGDHFAKPETELEIRARFNAVLDGTGALAPNWLLCIYPQDSSVNSLKNSASPSSIGSGCSRNGKYMVCTGGNRSSGGNVTRVGGWELRKDVPHDRQVCFDIQLYPRDGGSAPNLSVDDVGPIEDTVCYWTYNLRFEIEDDSSTSNYPLINVSPNTVYPGGTVTVSITNVCNNQPFADYNNGSWPNSHGHYQNSSRNQAPNIPISSTLYVDGSSEGGGNGSPSIGTSACGGITYTVTLDTNEDAGGEVCADAVIGVEYGWSHTGAGADRAGSFTVPSSTADCATVVESPYLEVFGNSVWSGFQTCNNGLNCYPNEATAESMGIISTTFNSVEGLGGFVEFAAFALNQISAFGSADTPNSNVLHFANTPSSGDYGTPTLKMQDLFEALEKPASGDCVTTDGLGTQCYFSGNRRITSGTPATNLGPGEKLTYIVEGNVRIQSDITYNYSGLGSPADVPAFALIVKGNITVDPGVTDLQGLYVAIDEDPSTNSGVFVSCATNNGDPNSPANLSFSGQCANNQLVIRGAVLAERMFFKRTYGSTSGNYTGTKEAAERIIFSPELYISKPYLRLTTGEDLDIEALLDLPPYF